MNKELRKHPILKILRHSDYDALITEIFSSIRKWPICWMAIEQIEDKFNGNKVHHSLWFHSCNNSIEFFNTSTDTLLARIEFDKQLLQLENTFTASGKEADL